MSFEVEPGEHTLQCKLEIASKSQVVPFVVDGEPVEFECEPRLGTVASPLGNLTDGDRHIVLRQVWKNSQKVVYRSGID